jgi:hypothetical protein
MTRADIERIIVMLLPHYLTISCWDNYVRVTVAPNSTTFKDLLKVKTKLNAIDIGLSISKGKCIALEFCLPKHVRD